jgi:hypothetical protein
LFPETKWFAKEGENGMSSKYEPVWRKYFPENQIDNILNILRADNIPGAFDVTDVMYAGDRSTTSWNVGITINRTDVIGNAAHLNSLAKKIRRHLKPGEVLRLETRMQGTRLILSIYFWMSTAKTIGEFARETEITYGIPPNQLDYDEDWDSGEDYVRERIVSSLKPLREKGIEVESVADKFGKGRDIVVKTSPHRIIEVKGYPSRKVSQGKSKGAIKTQSEIDNQALLWVWDAIRQLVEHKCERPDDEIALGLPVKEFYINYLNRIAWFRSELSIFVYLVYESEVKVFGTADNIS